MDIFYAHEEMSGLVFCCCSSGRPKMLVEKTLRTLTRAGYNGILWLVVPTEEVIAYQEAISGNSIMCMIIHCERGLVRQRKHFRSTMLPGTEIVFIDDDIEAIKIKTHAGLVHCQNIIHLANYVFEHMPENCLLAGVYPITNRDWMKFTYTKSNAYIVGALYFCKNDERLVEPEHDEMEDWYRCLSEQRAGRDVFRFNFFGITTQYFKNKGGLQAERTDSQRLAIVDQYVAEFPELVRKTQRKNQKFDLYFLERPIQYEVSPVQFGPP